MVIVEVQYYGDFDVLQTKSVWVHHSLTSFSKKSLTVDVDHDRYGEGTERELKQLGFSKIKTVEIPCGGDC